MNNITFIKQFTAQLTNTYLNQVTQLDKVRQDFIANVSHELRTPLTVLHGYLETWLENPNDNIEHDIVLQMHQQSSRMSRLIDGLLLLAKLEQPDNNSSEQTLINITELLTPICHEASALSAENQHTITTEIDKSLSIYGCTSELHSAFSNLIFNAVKYTPAHGRITVRWYKRRNEAVFEVEDTGIGIASKHIHRLTERFYRVDKARSRENGGTGLGLAIVKHVLARHNSKLRISSTPNKGSTFECRFKLGDAA